MAIGPHHGFLMPGPLHRGQSIYRSAKVASLCRGNSIKLYSFNWFIFNSVIKVLFFNCMALSKTNTPQPKISIPTSVRINRIYVHVHRMYVTKKSLMCTYERFVAGHCTLILYLQGYSRCSV